MRSLRLRSLGVALVLAAGAFGPGTVPSPAPAGADLPAGAQHTLATPAQRVGLALPSRVAVGADGSVYIADTFNHLVRRLDGSGTITTVAGTGSAGFSGDGGPAAAAQLDFPMGLALDPAGDLFIADEGNDRVRKVDRQGTITTIAGDGSGGAALGQVEADGDEGPATAAQINRPYGVAYASGVLYIADTQHNRIRSVTADGTIHAFAGSGRITLPPAPNGDGGPATDAAMLFPTSVAADAAGNVYVPEFLFNRIRRIDPAGTISTFAGDSNGRPGATGDGGPAAAARLAQPYDVAIDADGNLLIADSGNQSVRRVRSSAADATIETIAGTGAPGFSGEGGTATAAQLYGPFGVAAGGTTIYVADEGNNRIRAIDAAGTITTVAGTDAPTGPPPLLTATETGAEPPIRHVFEIVLENEESSSIYDSPAAPYLNSLLSQGVRLNAMFGVGHASLDNYLAMFAGLEPNPNTELDCSVAAPGCSVPADPSGLPTNLGDQIDAAGLIWKVYAESMPAPCTYAATAPTSYSTPYAERHNPGVFFHSIIDDPVRCAAHVVLYDDPTSGLAADLATAATTPNFALIVPNAIHDGHDGTPPDSIAAADSWLAQNVPAILASAAYQDGGLLIITFDEGVSTQGCCAANPGGGKIATLVLSPLAQAGVSSDVPYNHYSVLRTIEDALGLQLLNHAGDAAVKPFGSDIWR